MCVSRFYKVLRRVGTVSVEVEDVNHVTSHASLLAYEGGELSAGDWVSVLSGYVIDRADPVEAASAAEEIRQAQASWVKGGAS
jgi:hydrogenase maturation factor